MKDNYKEQNMNNVTNVLIEKIRNAGIEVVIEKSEFENILKKEEHLQKMQEILSEENINNLFISHNDENLNTNIDKLTVDDINLRDDFIKISDKTPFMFKECGLDDYPINMYKQKLARAFFLEKETFGERRTHGHKGEFTEIEVKKVFENISNPRYIFNSKQDISNPDNFYLIGVYDVFDKNNEPMMLSLHFDKNRKEVEANWITAVYGKNKNILVDDWTRKGYLIYKNDLEIEKAPAEVVTLYMRVSKSASAYENNVKHKSEYVNNMDILLMKEGNRTYGFTYNGKIYLNPEIMNSNAAVHEYTHLWDAYTQKTNPKLWNKGLNLFKDTKYWNEVISDPNYQDIKDDENLVLSEIHSRICGDIAEKVLDRIAELDGEQVKLDAVDWDEETWNYVISDIGFHQFNNVFHKFNYINSELKIKTSDLKDFLSMPMKDLINSKNISLDNLFGNFIKVGKVEADDIPFTRFEYKIDDKSAEVLGFEKGDYRVLVDMDDNQTSVRTYTIQSINEPFEDDIPIQNENIKQIFKQRLNQIVKEDLENFSINELQPEIITFKESGADVNQLDGKTVLFEVDSDYISLENWKKLGLPELSENATYAWLNIANTSEGILKVTATSLDEKGNTNPDNIDLNLDSLPKDTLKIIRDSLKKGLKEYDAEISDNEILTPNEYNSGLSFEDLKYIHSEEFISKFGDWEKAQRLEKLKDSEPIFLSSKIISNGIDYTDEIDKLRNENSKENLRKLVSIVENIGKEMLSNLRTEQNLNNFESPVITNFDTKKDFKLNFSGIKETSHHNMFQKGHIEGIVNIPNLIENSIFITSENNEDNRKPNLKKFHYFASGTKIDDIDYTAKIVFTETKDGELYYDQSLSTIEKGKLIDLIKGNEQEKRLEAFNLINRQDSNEPYGYYDKRLINICQVPQMPYLDKNLFPTKEVINLVKEGALSIKKEGQEYKMINKDESILKEILEVAKDRLENSFDWREFEANDGFEKLKNLPVPNKDDVEFLYNTLHYGENGSSECNFVLRNLASEREADNLVYDLELNNNFATFDYEEVQNMTFEEFKKNAENEIIDTELSNIQGLTKYVQENGLVFNNSKIHGFDSVVIEKTNEHIERGSSLYTDYSVHLSNGLAKCLNYPLQKDEEAVLTMEFKENEDGTYSAGNYWLQTHNAKTNEWSLQQNFNGNFANGEPINYKFAQLLEPLIEKECLKELELEKENSQSQEIWGNLKSLNDTIQTKLIENLWQKGDVELRETWTEELKNRGEETYPLPKVDIEWAKEKFKNWEVSKSDLEEIKLSYTQKEVNQILESNLKKTVQNVIGDFEIGSDEKNQVNIHATFDKNPLNPHYIYPGQSVYISIPLKHCQKDGIIDEIATNYEKVYGYKPIIHNASFTKQPSPEDYMRTNTGIHINLGFDGDFKEHLFEKNPTTEQSKEKDELTFVNPQADEIFKVKKLAPNQYEYTYEVEGKVSDTDVVELKHDYTLFNAAELISYDELGIILKDNFELQENGIQEKLEKTEFHSLNYSKDEDVDRLYKWFNYFVPENLKIDSFEKAKILLSYATDFNDGDYKFAINEKNEIYLNTNADSEGWKKTTLTDFVKTALNNSYSLLEDGYASSEEKDFIQEFDEKWTTRNQNESLGNSINTTKDFYEFFKDVGSLGYLKAKINDARDECEENGIDNDDDTVLPVAIQNMIDSEIPIENTELIEDITNDILNGKYKNFADVKANYKENYKEFYDELQDTNELEELYSPLSKEALMKFINIEGIDSFTEKMAEHCLGIYENQNIPLVTDELGNVYQREMSKDLATGTDEDLTMLTPSDLIDFYRSELEREREDLESFIEPDDYRMVKDFNNKIAYLDSLEESLIKIEERQNKTDSLQFDWSDFTEQDFNNLKEDLQNPEEMLDNAYGSVKIGDISIDIINNYNSDIENGYLDDDFYIFGEEGYDVNSVTGIPYDEVDGDGISFATVLGSDYETFQKIMEKEWGEKILDNQYLLKEAQRPTLREWSSEEAEKLYEQKKKEKGIVIEKESTLNLSSSDVGDISLFIGDEILINEGGKENIANFNVRLTDEMFEKLGLFTSEELKNMPEDEHNDVDTTIDYNPQTKDANLMIHFNSKKHLYKITGEGKDIIINNLETYCLKAEGKNVQDLINYIDEPVSNFDIAKNVLRTNVLIFVNMMCSLEKNGISTKDAFIAIKTVRGNDKNFINSIQTLFDKNGIRNPEKNPNDEQKLKTLITKMIAKEKTINKKPLVVKTSEKLRMASINKKLHNYEDRSL